jgi:Helix-turn-helix domain
MSSLLQNQPRVGKSAGPNNSNVSFTGAKMDWMTAAAYDPRLKASDFRVAFVIAQHINESTGKGYPSEKLIADRIGTHERTVMRAVKVLHETGWLKIRRSRSYDPKTKTWKTRNAYWMRHENVQTVFDAITASKLGQRFKCDTHVTLTPSQRLQIKREVRESPLSQRDRGVRGPIAEKRESLSSSQRVLSRGLNEAKRKESAANLKLRLMRVVKGGAL